MIDSLNPRNTRDFRQRYQNTFGFFEVEKGKKIIVRVGEVGDRYMVFTDADKIEYKANNGAGVNFEFIQVPRGWFNGNNSVYMLSRVPTRQWQRGICESNTAALLLQPKSIATRNICFEILNDIFGETPKIEDCIATWLRGDAGVALTKHFAASSGGILYLYQTQVGKINQKRRTIEVEEEVFRQEIIDMNKRTKLNFEVK